MDRKNLLKRSISVIESLRSGEYNLSNEDKIKHQTEVLKDVIRLLEDLENG